MGLEGGLSVGETGESVPALEEEDQKSGYVVDDDESKGGFCDYFIKLGDENSEVEHEDRGFGKRGGCHIEDHACPTNLWGG